MTGIGVLGWLGIIIGVIIILTCPEIAKAGVIIILTCPEIAKAIGLVIFAIGFLLCFTFIGAVAGIPMMIIGAIMLFC